MQPIPLTPADTYEIYISALPNLTSWADILNQDITYDADNLTAWTVTLHNKVAPGDPITIGHTDVLDAIAAGATPEPHSLREDIAGPLQAIVNATTNEQASEHLVDLDVDGFDAVIQIAALGGALYS